MTTKNEHIALPFHTDFERLGAVDVKALAQKAHADKALRESFFAMMLKDNGRESRNAAWVLTHLPSPDDIHIAAYRDALVQLALTTYDTSLRRLTLNLLERIEWDEDNLRSDLLDFCLLRIVDPNETYGVRALCIKLAWHQCRHYEELRDELRQTLLVLDPNDLKPGLKHTWNKMLKEIATIIKPLP